MTTGEEKFQVEYKRNIQTVLSDDHNHKIYCYIQRQKTPVTFPELHAVFDDASDELSHRLQSLEEACLIERDFYLRNKEIHSQFTCRSLLPEMEKFVDSING